MGFQEGDWWKFFSQLKFKNKFDSQKLLALTYKCLNEICRAKKKKKLNFTSDYPKAGTKISI
jgi:hypothetical protein